MSEERDDIVVLEDEDGNSEEYELLDIVEYDEKRYAVLLPYSEEDDDEDEVIIMGMTDDEDDDESSSFEEVFDEVLLDKVFEEFKLNNSDRFDFLEDE